MQSALVLIEQIQVPIKIFVTYALVFDFLLFLLS